MQYHKSWEINPNSPPQNPNWLKGQRPYAKIEPNWWILSAPY